MRRLPLMFELWRTDIHGNDFFMRTFESEEEAERERQMFEDRGHHQTYWVKRAGQLDARGRLRGTVLAYDDDEGEGTIRGEDGDEYAVRFNEIAIEGFRTLTTGDTVIFKPDANEATDVRPAP